MGSRPFILVFVTASIDGKLASRIRYSKLSCPFDKQRQYWLRSQVDGVVVGVNTVIIDDPTLRPKGFRRSRSAKYYRIVLDGCLRIPMNARVLDTSEYGTIIITRVRDPEWKIRELEARGVEILAVRSLDEAMQRLLKDYGLRRIMVEGGGETIWSFIRSRLVDEFRITVAPKVFGGSRAVTVVGGEGFLGPEAPSMELKFVGVCKCRREVHMVYDFPAPRGTPAEGGPEVGGDFVYELYLK